MQPTAQAVGQKEEDASPERGERAVADSLGPQIRPEPQNMFLNPQNRNPASIIEAGRVSSQAIARLRTVDHCNPEWFAAMVPAMPEDSTCVVLTGSPNQSAAPIVNIAVISAAAP